MPNSDSTPMDLGGEKFNPQQTWFKSRVCRFGSYRFRVHIDRFWVRWSGAKSGRILAEILLDLIRFEIFPYIYKYRAEILMDLAEIYLFDRLKGLDLSVFGRVCDFCRGKNSSLGGSGLSVS